MIRGRRCISVALRRPNGSISTTTTPLQALFASRLRGIPLVRGLAALGESMTLGLRTMLQSEKITSGKGAKKPSTTSLWFWLTTGVILSLVLFLVIPLLATWGLDRFIPSALLSNVTDGIIRIIIFVLYLRFISLIPEMKWLFSYHGAEHKVVNAYEAGASLEVEGVKGYSTAHTRCGTAFILIILVLALIALAFTGRPPLWLRFVERIVLLPFIIAVGYEIMRFTAGHIRSGVVRVLIAPSLALQALTTRQPDDSQLEVAIAALKGAVEADEGALTHERNTSGSPCGTQDP
jgi:hypothetical protein